MKKGKLSTLAVLGVSAGLVMSGGNHNPSESEKNILELDGSHKTIETRLANADCSSKCNSCSGGSIS